MTPENVKLHCCFDITEEKFNTPSLTIQSGYISTEVLYGIEQSCNDVKFFTKGDRFIFSEAIRQSKNLINGYILSGRALTDQAREVLARQLSVASANLDLTEDLNRNGQGDAINDPILVASGIERFHVEDFSYKTLQGPISIDR